jgi:hypothetical protein
MREIWREENTRTFYGRLPKPRFSVVCLLPENRGLWHICRDNRHIIRLDPTCHKTKKDVRSTMLHEMIHQLQDISKSSRTRREMHGRFFQYHAARILNERNIIV